MVLVGLAGFLVSVTASWVPSIWGDEAATVMSATRPLGSLFPMLATVDAVHGTYYLFMHGWIALFGQSPLSIRFPSALAVGATSALLVVVVRRAAPVWVAVAAGLVFAVLPRVAYIGTEARSFAIATALATLSVSVGSALLRGGDAPRRRYVAWTVLVAVQVDVFLYSALLLPAVVLGVWLAGDLRRAALVRWLRWSALGVVGAGPVIGFALGQRDQISFLRDTGSLTPASFFVAQWFGSVPVAVVGWTLVAVALAGAVVERVRTGRTDPLVATAASWLVLPPLVLWLANTFIAPLYTPRYMSIVLPAVAVLVALGLRVLWRLGTGRVAGRGVVVGVVAAVFLVCCVPGVVATKRVTAKDGGNDWSLVSAYLGRAHRPGDGIVFDDHVNNARNPRSAMYVYPEDYRGLVDPTLVTPRAETTGLRDVTRSVADSAASFDGVGRVWYVDRRASGEPVALRQLRALGYRVESRERFLRDDVYLLER